MATNSLLAPCRAGAAVEKDATPLWSASVQTRADLDNVWRVVDEHAESLLHSAKSPMSLFHQNRQLVVKHLPRDVTEHEIRELLQGRGFKVGVVQLSLGGPGPNWARAQILDVGPEFWEEWPAQQQQQQHQHQQQQKCGNGATIRGHKVTIVASATENLLCVARLPRDLPGDEFRRLVSHYGDVRFCFLLCSDKTGESKGYGFVEYASREAGQRARSQLDGLLYEGHLIACDWLDASTVTFGALHSKLLYVDCLPPGFRDMGQFRKLFSAVANPPYCQIALKGGAPQDWGLVEFSQAKEAEETLLALDGRLFNGAHLRVAFFIPGVRAINIYMKLINDTCQNKGKAALLPEPPTDTVFHQLQNLTKQNPAFVQSLQNIILTQIQTLNNPPSSSAPHSGSSGSCGAVAPGAGPRSGPPCHGNRPRSANSGQTSAQLAANAQAALSMLLAAQQQAGPTSSSPAPVHTIPPPPAARAPVTCSFRPQFAAQGPANQLLMEAPPLNVSVPPPPLYRAPPPPPVNRPPAPATPAAPSESCDLQKTLSMLLGTLSSAVQSLSPTPPPPPAHPPAQAAAGALLGLLLQLIQSSGNLAPAQQPQSTLSPLSLNTVESYPHAQPDRNGLLTTAPPVGQYYNHFQVAPPPLGSPGPTSWTPRDAAAPASPAGNSSTGSHVTSWTNVLGQVRQMGSGPSSLGSTGSRGSSPTSSSSPSTSPGRQHPPPPPPPSAAPGASTSFATPVGTKRKYNHVLPSPEPSPEHGYVGQHSQGLGGHYADSYFNKRKKRN